MDHPPNGYDLPWSVHAVIFAYGVGLVDNALLEPLAAACAEEGRYEFMLMVLAASRARWNGSPAEPARDVLEAPELPEALPGDYSWRRAPRFPALLCWGGDVLIELVGVLTDS